MSLLLAEDTLVAGVDEAGRGPLAGPVVAAACIFVRPFHLPGLTDSKKLTPKQREEFCEILVGHPDVAWGLGVVESEEIDRVNIFQATFVAMQKAVAALNVQPHKVLVDGKWSPALPMPVEAIIKGDEKVPCISAGSVIAKVTRDKMMVECAQKWPEYGFEKHKGYGTKAHLQAIEKYGPCPIHRMSYAPLKGEV